MKTESRILFNVVASFAVSALIAFVAFGVLRGLNAEFKRIQTFGDITNKTYDLHVLTASFREESVRSDVHQAREILLSLDGLLKNLSSREPREQILIEHLQKSHKELGPLIDQWFTSGQVQSGVERERRGILSSQIWMKIQFISDDSKRLEDISQSNIVAAQKKTAATIIALIVVLVLANGTIYILSMRSIVRAQRALAVSEQRYRGIVETAEEGIATHAPDGTITYVNQRMADMLGYPREEIIGKSSLEFVDDEEKKAVIQARESLKEQGSFSKERKLSRKDSSVLWTLVNVSPQRDGSGNFLGYLAMHTDITERKRGEEERARLASFPILNPKPIIETDLEGNVIYANPSAQKLFPDLIECGRRHPYLADWVKLKNSCIGAKGNSTRDIVVADRWYNQVIHHLEEIQRIRIYGLDITERKRAEEVLTESEERYRTLFNSINEAFTLKEAVFDSKGEIVDFRFIDVNPAFTQQAGLREVVGKTMLEVMPGIEPRWIERFAHVAKTGKPMRFQDRVGGLGRWFDVFTSRVDRVHEEARPQLVVLFNDISERKQAEEALRQAKEELEARVQERTQELAVRAKQLRALAGELTISEQRERKRLSALLHDHLQQLLVGAKFRLSVLAKTGDDGIKVAAKDVEELIDESIKSSRSLTAELSPPILHDSGLNAGLEWLGRRMADTQGLFVDLTAEQTGPLPEDMTVLLFEAVRELLFNVAKHADTQSASVRLCCTDGSLQLTVSDEGIGFDPQFLPPPGEEGRGFGLFSIGERLELFGGKLEVDSAPGRGSRIVLSVPITGVESRSSEIAEFPNEIFPKLIQTRAPGRKIRVLLADDHAVVRQGIASLLRQEQDIEIVGAASDGQEAIDVTPKLLPDVILMDMSMPTLNGVEATRIIHSRYPEIRIIGLSMFEEAEKTQEMRDAGAVNYLSKSGPAEDLINSIRASVRYRL